jgi:hypothetical protein
MPFELYAGGRLHTLDHDQEKRNAMVIAPKYES